MIEIAMRVVGEQRLAGCGLRAGDDPVVAAFAARGALPVEARGRRVGVLGGAEFRRCADVGEVRVQLAVDRRQIDARRDRHRRRRIERQEHRRQRGANLRRHARPEDFVPRVARHDEAFGATQKVFGLPGFRAVAGDVEFFGKIGVRDRNPRVDTRDEARRDLPGIGRVTLPIGFLVAAVAHQPRHPVARHVVGSEDLRQPALRRPPPEIDLEEPVLRLDESLREEQIVGVLRVDVRDAPAVADDADFVGEAGDRKRAGGLSDARVGSARRRRRRGGPARTRGRREHECHHHPMPRAVRFHIRPPQTLGALLFSGRRA